MKGANQSDAEREAYDAENMSDSTVWNEASKLFTQGRRGEQDGEDARRHPTHPAPAELLLPHSRARKPVGGRYGVGEWFAARVILFAPC